MNNPNDFYQDDLEELLSQVDDLLLRDAPPPEQPEEEDDFDLSDYAPADSDDDEPVVFQNYSNRYGADLRNFSNGYGTGVRSEEEPKPAQPSIPAYNADFRRPDKAPARKEPVRREPPRENPPRETYRSAYPEQPRSDYRDYGSEEGFDDAPPARTSKAAKAAKPEKKKKKKGCCGCGCSTMLAAFGALALACVLLFNWVFAVPKSDVSIGSRKRDTATILICGTDWEGARTDTMMLLYLSGSEHKVGLLSLPRDSLTVTSSGSYAKLNSAYGRNGSGAEGMEGLLDYVQEIIGYRPDGYMLIAMDLVPQIVDAMGGVDVDVPMSFDLGGEHLEAGYQHLTGSQVLQLLRYREGYAMQDLDRVTVQRSVISACLDQWFTLDHIGDVTTALELVQNNSLTTLNVRNYLWMAKTVLLSLGDISTDTLPGYADYIDGVSYYILSRSGIAELINESYNPYKQEILAENLKIAG